MATLAKRTQAIGAILAIAGVPAYWYHPGACILAILLGLSLFGIGRLLAALS